MNIFLSWKLYPNKRQALTCVVLMLAHRLRRWPNVKTTLVKRIFAGMEFKSANTKQSPAVDSMLAHRLRRWSNIEPTVGECLVFAGLID